MIQILSIIALVAAWMAYELLTAPYGNGKPRASVNWKFFFRF